MLPKITGLGPLVKIHSSSSGERQAGQTLGCRRKEKCWLCHNTYHSHLSSAPASPLELRAESSGRVATSKEMLCFEKRCFVENVLGQWGTSDFLCYSINIDCKTKGEERHLGQGSHLTSQCCGILRTRSHPINSLGRFGEKL